MSRKDRTIRIAPTVIAALLAVLAMVPQVDSLRSWVLYLFLFYIYLAMANMWNLLAGYSGLVSLCQPAFLGLAGYTLAICTWVGVPWWAALGLGGACATVFALLLCVCVFRLQGAYFAIGTLMVPEALRMFFYLWKPVGGSMQGGGAGYMIKGIGGIPGAGIYWLALVLGSVSVLVVRLVLRSRLGLGLAAIRDNERTAAAAGVDVLRLKISVFTIAAAVTGLAGAVYYLRQGYIEPSATFNVRWTMTMLLATVIGGIRSREGPFLGSAVVVFLYFFLARYPGYSLLVQGVILIVIILLSPRGLAGLLHDATKKMRPSATTPLPDGQSRHR